MSGVLDNVKVGDKLFVTSRWRKAIEVVENVTKLHVVTTRGNKYRKTGGSVDDDSWMGSSARPATEEDVDNIRKEIVRNMKLSGGRKITFDNLTDTQLEQILKIVIPDILNGK